MARTQAIKALFETSRTKTLCKRPLCVTSGERDILHRACLCAVSQRFLAKFLAQILKSRLITKFTKLNKYRADF